MRSKSGRLLFLEVYTEHAKKFYIDRIIFLRRSVKQILEMQV